MSNQENSLDLREVLARIKNLADDYEQCVTKAGALDRIYDLACTALSEPPGNCASGSKTMSEACQKTLDLLMLHGNGKCRCVLTWDEFNDTQKMLRAALAKPLRNCDVGTPEEQMKWFEAYCNAHEPCESCPLDRPRVCPSCGVHWAQMPYNEKE